MTYYELDAAIAQHHRAGLAADAARARLAAERLSLRSRVAAALRGLAAALEPAPIGHPRTAA